MQGPYKYTLIVLIMMPYDASRDWWESMPEGRTANWVLGNHDNWRLGRWWGRILHLEFLGPPPEYGPRNGFAPIKNISHGAA